MPDWLTERTILLSLHIVTAILFLGPTTVAASLFPRYAAAGDLTVARVLRRVTAVYGPLSMLVAVIGVVLAWRIDAIDRPWVSWSLGLFVLAAAIQVVVIDRGQNRAVAALERGDGGVTGLGPLRAGTGVFSLIWVVIVVLMVGKPS